MPTQTEDQKKASYTSAGVALPPISVAGLQAPATPFNIAPTTPLPNVPPPIIPEVPKTPDVATDLTTKLGASIASLGGKDAVSQKRQVDAAAPYIAQLTELNKQADLSVKQELETDEAIRRSGGDVGFQSSERAKAARTSAIERLGLSAMAQAAQGNIALAQTQAKAAVDAEFAVQEQRTESLRQMTIDNYDTFSDDQKKRADAYLLKLDKDDAFVAQQKAEREAVNKVMITAIGFGADPMAVQKIRDADTFEDAVSAAGSFLRDPRAKYEVEGARLDNDLKRAQIRKLNIENNQSVETAGSIIPSVSDGAIGATGVKEGALNAITKLKLAEGQANAVSYAFRMIEANAEINEQLGDGEKITGRYNPTTVFSGIGRTFRSDNARQLDRGLENFIRAQLRKESGAQIADSEMEGGKRIYSPQGILTNKKDVVATKGTREQAIQSMIAQAGPAGTYLKQYYDYMQTGGLLPEDREVIYGGGASTPALISGSNIW